MGVASDQFASIPWKIVEYSCFSIAEVEYPCGSEIEYLYHSVVKYSYGSVEFVLGSEVEYSYNSVIEYSYGSVEYSYASEVEYL